MIIAITKETLPNESRVSLTPHSCADFVKSGHKIRIESGAGLHSYYTDEEYKKAGVEVIKQKQDLYKDADIITKVSPFSIDELSIISKNTIIISLIQPTIEQEIVIKAKERNLTGLSMHLIPRTTLAQKMDALSSQANIAGYKAVIMGSMHIGVYMPLLMTAAGTIRPAKVLIIGAGVAGLQAIATAKRLGAQVEAFDVRPEVKEQVESLGAKFVEVESTSDDGVGEGGYAKETSDEYKQKQAELLKEYIGDSDLVITTALIPGRAAPKIITKEMVDGMKGGTAIMDLASENGGNCEYTEPGKIIDHNGITIDGSFNIPGTMSIHASQVYAKNISALVTYLCPEGKLKLDMDDEIVSGALFTHNGDITDERTKEALGGMA